MAASFRKAFYQRKQEQGSKTCSGRENQRLFAVTQIRETGDRSCMDQEIRDRLPKLMADLDENTQAQMSGLYKTLQDAGFKGVQTPDLPYHITMAILPLDWEDKAVEKMQKLASLFPELRHCHFLL